MKEWTLFHVNDFITLIMDFSLKTFYELFDLTWFLSQ